MLGRVRYMLFIQLTLSVHVTSHEEVSWSLTLRQKIRNIHILIGHINVNKGVFCLIISYLQIKIYNVLNYNNCSTDWPFPLSKRMQFVSDLRQVDDFLRVLRFLHQKSDRHNVAEILLKVAFNTITYTLTSIYICVL